MSAKTLSGGIFGIAPFHTACPVIVPPSETVITWYSARTVLAFAQSPKQQADTKKEMQRACRNMEDLIDRHGTGSPMALDRKKIKSPNDPTGSFGLVSGTLVGLLLCQKGAMLRLSLFPVKQSDHRGHRITGMASLTAEPPLLISRSTGVSSPKAQVRLHWSDRPRKLLKGLHS